MEFEWDPYNAARNLRKHNVSFQEAATVFSDPLSMTFIDPEHSIEENRYITIGLSHSRRLVIMSHTNRGDRIRIISAREAMRKERKFYEEKRKR